MITAKNITKKFDNFTALQNLSCNIPDGCIYGLVGSNGAGKSTFLRLLSGVYKADEGTILIDGEEVFDNPSAKVKIAYIPDDLYFLPQASLNKMAKSYKNFYPSFSMKRFRHLSNVFGLNPKANLNTFSKGMRRQAAIILGLSLSPKYLFFDETFDGLDPVMRSLVKKVIYDDVLENKTTVIITSHSLRELEDTCDQLALLHKGGIIFESDINNLKTSLFKVQVAFNKDFDKTLFDGIEMLEYSQKGSVANFIVRGDRDETSLKIQAMSPVLLDVLPLSLEEVFVYEMEALGYAFNDVLEKGNM